MNTNDRNVDGRKVTQPIKSACIALLVLFNANCLLGQQSLNEEKAFSYSRNYVSVKLENGFNAVNYTPKSGEDKPAFSVGHIHQLKLDYTYFLTEHFGLGLGGGIGAFPFAYRVDEKGNFTGTTEWRYWQLANYNLFCSLNAGVDYRKVLKPRWQLKTFLGAGLFRTGELLAIVGGQGPFGAEYGFLYEYPGKNNYFLSSRVGADYTLQNDNLLGFSVGYDFFLNPVYTGKYELYGTSSSGTLVNKGHNVNLGLSYTFTGVGKRKTLLAAFYEKKDLSLNKVKKELRQERREIKPGSIFIGLMGGLFYTRNKFVQDHAHLHSASFPSWSVGLNIEKGIREKFFLQLMGTVQEYISGVKVKINESFGFASSHQAFVGGQVSAGIGIRLIDKRNINYLNLSSGIDIGSHFNSNGQVGGSGLSFTGGDGVQKTLAGQSFFRSSFFTGVYLNASRDFQLTKNFYLSLAYKYSVGFFKTYEEVFTYSTATPDDVPLTLNKVVKGTGASFLFGIKYKFAPATNKE